MEGWEPACRDWLFSFVSLHCTALRWIEANNGLSSKCRQTGCGVVTHGEMAGRWPASIGSEASAISVRGMILSGAEGRLGFCPSEGVTVNHQPDVSSLHGDLGWKRIIKMILLKPNRCYLVLG